jgi:3-deoxy-D-manno-octulosonic-acid transferase
VGEIEAVRPVLRRLGREVGKLEVAVTTMTQAGRDAAERRLPGLASYQLAPLDFRSAVRAFLRKVQPDLILITETELWPNFFREGARARARIALINGRLSSTSLRRYRLVRGLVRDALAVADRLLVQTAADYTRFRELGAAPERLFVTGNTKFDLDDDPSALRPELAAFAPNRPILVAGSTAPGEERIVLAAYRRLLRDYPSLALILAPRHLERTGEIERILHEESQGYLKASELDSGGANGPAILLLDTMGELRPIYRRAAIAFVGGSIAPPRGGQSLAEPAAAGVPVLFGVHYENQQQLGDALILAGAGLVIHDDSSLAGGCQRWLSDYELRQAAGLRARRVLEHLADGAANTVHHLLPLLDRA